MCLSIPGKIIRIKKNQRAVADFNGVEKEINTALVTARTGDYVMVHAGFAIEKIIKDDAMRILKIFKNG